MGRALRVHDEVGMEKGSVFVVVGALTTAIASVTGAQVSGAPQVAAAPRPLVVTAENMSATEANGARTGDRNVLRPGDVVRYRLAFTNTRPDSIRQVQFNDRIPPGLRYVVGSASADRPDVAIEFSIDSGRTYTARPEVEEVVNGEKVRRPAAPERYTHVRWSAQGWVRARASVMAEFKVQLPAVSAGTRGR